MKPRSVIPFTKNLILRDDNNPETKTGQVYDFETLKFETEQPRGSLEEFDARLLPLQSASAHQVPVSVENFLPREAVLRNADWIIGVAVFTGHETRVMKGQQKSPQKVSAIDKLVSRLVICLMIFQVLICASVGILCYAWLVDVYSSRSWYLPLDEEPAGTRAILTLFSMFLLTGTMIPISLLVTVEMVKFIQALYISWDHRLVYQEKDYKGAVIRTQGATWSSSTLNEELGQVRYVFSDKTGTLTTNTMVFMAACVGVKQYGQGREEEDEMKIERRASDIERRRSNLMDMEVSNVMNHEEMIDDAKGNHDPRYARFQGASNERALKLGGVDVGSGVVLLKQKDLCENFIHALALCQDVNVEFEDDQMIYSGLSPDEVCLVETARMWGWSFVERGETHVTLRIGREGVDDVAGLSLKTLKFELLNFIKFTNSRKRSTVIFRDEKYPGKVLMYSKGADDVMLTACDGGGKKSVFLKKAQDSCDVYSRLGLRTLCVAMKVLDNNTYADWSARYQEASCVLDAKQKEERLVALQTEIEAGMSIIGCTATEDKIQDGVPECIERMRQANISVWMITGDKLDTACEIAKSCRLIDSATMRVDVIDEPSREGTKKRLMDMPLTMSAISKLEELRKKRMEEEAGKIIHGSWVGNQDQKNDNDDASTPFAVVISGRSLQHVFDDIELTEHFFVYSCSCVSAVVCRATKMQKAQVVYMIKSRMAEVITLSIGDGANDVPMLKEAHVGIGVHGKEGSQAVQNSDYAIAQFRFLERLLFSHGRDSYIRITGLIKYFFYKNITFTAPQIFFPFICAFSGASLYEDWYISTFNLCWTSLPILLYGILEWDVREEGLKSKDTHEYFPRLYATGQKNSLFAKEDLLGDWTLGFCHAVICFVMCVLSGITPVNSIGQQDGFWIMSMTLYTSVVFVVTINLFIRSRSWFMPGVVIGIASLVVYVLFMAVYNYISVNSAYLEAGVFFATPRFYLCIIINLVICSMTSIAWESYKRWYRASDIDVFVELRMKERLLAQAIEKRVESNDNEENEVAVAAFVGAARHSNRKSGEGKHQEDKDDEEDDEEVRMYYRDREAASKRLSSSNEQATAAKPTPQTEHSDRAVKQTDEISSLGEIEEELSPRVHASPNAMRETHVAREVEFDEPITDLQDEPEAFSPSPPMNNLMSNPRYDSSSFHPSTVATQLPYGRVPTDALSIGNNINENNINHVQINHLSHHPHNTNNNVDNNHNNGEFDFDEFTPANPQGIQSFNDAPRALTQSVFMDKMGGSRRREGVLVVPAPEEEAVEEW
eukprot:GDKJ01035101.1.p1 GENE.GDKJ01035101.1~~GDKJ01035101.1.p1  ORF type:complete len:1436 (+),score=374.33 GDKJ01035101.1:437-4309(+)